MSGRFDVERFLELRRARVGLGWGEPLTYSEETGSTNDDALAAARQGAASGSVFLAEQQTAGRGRRGRRWLAESGQSLLFSVLVRPAAKAQPSGAPPGAQTGALTLAVGLGVRAALAAYSAQPLGVKWPNDVLCARRKLAGILCESQLQAGNVDAVVIGIGINVGQQAFPPELASDVTSVAELCGIGLGGSELGATALGGRSPSREQLLVDVLAQVERRALVCEGAGLPALLDEFRAHDALRDSKVTVSGAREIVGIARGIDDQGQLLLDTDGIVLAVHSGTVRLA